MGCVDGGSIRLALVGIGKIARDQHLASIEANPAFTLVATTDPTGGIAQVPNFQNVGRMLSECGLDAISVCTPPNLRTEIAAPALQAGIDVMLEKPPASSVAQADRIKELAAREGRSIFFTWHSRKAAGVPTAAQWCAQRHIEGVSVRWRENIRQWHPGQDWLLEADGFGVLDPGINAFSILTAILPRPLQVVSAELSVPTNRRAPIAAGIVMESGLVPIDVDLDFLWPHAPTWQIRIRAADGELVLDDGGARLAIDQEPVALPQTLEYRALYADFALLIRNKSTDADVSPLEIIEDILAVGKVNRTEPFHF